MTIKVLIVEDEFIVANDLRVILEQAGYHVNGIAASMDEAEEMLRNELPDLVLLDIRLKGKQSGIDLAKKLRAKNIAFIYLSANSNQQVLEEAKTTEPYGFLVKPFRVKDLLVAMEIAWYRHQHSLESKLRQEEFLLKALNEISNSSTGAEEKLLHTGLAIRSAIPFDFIACNTRSKTVEKFTDIGYLRTGFDEYQFIGEKEFLNITGIKKSQLSLLSANNIANKSSIIYEDEISKDINYALQKILFDSFKLESCIIFPVIAEEEMQSFYFFYSRQRAIYTANHISLLNRLINPLTNIAANMFLPIPPGTGKKNTASEPSPEFKNIIGKHPLLLASLDLAAQVAPYTTSVLILGESGTGKERVAHTIHSLSPRKNKPFIKVNCAAIPATLIESALFGHEKGAFTGAIEKRKGKFEQADGGTIFLDEVGELPPDMQVKLLRVLQEKEIEYVGGTGLLKLNVRIITATNRNLEKEVADGRFRLDLYYRLNVFPVSLPPLRERKTDIEALSIFFADRFCREFNKTFTGIAPMMMENMLAYHWPGNIRELENVIEQAVILSNGNSPLTLKRNLTDANNESIVKKTINTLDDVKDAQHATERDYILSVLKKTNGRIRGVNGAAEIMNIKPTTLESKMNKLNIKKQDSQ